MMTYARAKLRSLTEGTTFRIPIGSWSSETKANSSYWRISTDLTPSQVKWLADTLVKFDDVVIDFVIQDKEYTLQVLNFNQIFLLSESRAEIELEAINPWKDKDKIVRLKSTKTQEILPEDDVNLDEDLSR